MDTVRISNLKINTTEDMLEDHFSHYGVISKIEIKSDPSGASKYAYIKYWDPQQAKAVKACMNGKLFRGRHLKIDCRSKKLVDRNKLSFVCLYDILCEFWVKF